MQDVLLRLSRRARRADSAVELGFIIANETHNLVAYRQSVLWLKSDGVVAISGVVTPEANAPFIHWLNRLADHFIKLKIRVATIVEPSMLPQDVAAEWDEWLPGAGLWMPFIDSQSNMMGGFFLAREQIWTTENIALLTEWIDIWLHAWQSKQLQQRHFNVMAWLKERMSIKGRRLYIGLLVVAFLLIPIRMTVLVPGELVPVQPSTIRSPLEGTVDRFFVAPNARVKAGERLLALDSTLLSSKLKVSQEALATAEAEYRQAAQQAVFDTRSKSQLAQLQGKIVERSAEVDYLQSQLSRTQIVAPIDGIVLVDDASEWIGKPVVTGERIMTIADEHQVEVEAWLSPDDLINFPKESNVKLFLNASPLHPVRAKLRYISYEAVARPDGRFAYRLRATLSDNKIASRVGLKGTARVAGGYVPLGYWVMRRPLAFIRPYIEV